MRWKKFFTLVDNMSAEEARRYLAERSVRDYTLLDVRQPSEHERERIPGAHLIPLPELSGRLDELDKDRPVIVY